MNIGIIDYPGALKSAVYGLKEMFSLLSYVAAELESPTSIEIDIIDVEDIIDMPAEPLQYQAVILPPNLLDSYYLDPDKSLLDCLQNWHGQGAILCSACAGTFIIAATGLLSNREAVTHWNLVGRFQGLYPDVNLNQNKIVCNDGDIITAGGMMSWLDLGLELAAQMTSAALMRKLGKLLVVDTGQREQRFYQQFSPCLNHGDDVILNVQHNLQQNYVKNIKISQLAASCYLTERTFQRRFNKATGLNPNKYLQRLRVQKACDLIENTSKTFEAIAAEVGYTDASACRKAFLDIVGLSPKAFKRRFVGR